MSATARYDSRRTAIVPGSRYAPVRKLEYVNYAGGEVLGYRITRPLAAVDSHRRWELVCPKCEQKKPVNSSVLNALFDGRDDGRLRPCRCEVGGFRSAAVKDELGISAEQLSAMLWVLSHERAFGFGPLRLELEGKCSGTPDTAPLVRKGWLKGEGRPIRLTSTARARKALGVTIP